MTTSTVDNTTLLRGIDLSRVYRGDSGWFASGPRRTVRALEDVTISVQAGEVVGIAGPSGSGKSTLLHLLAGLDTPTSGQVHFGETEVSSLGSRKRAGFRLHNVGIVFQRFFLIPSLSARENVALPLVDAGVSRARRRERADELLERIGLGDRTDHRPSRLSGGEQQRVAIARALVTDPALIVADEPTGELDTDTGERVLDLLTELGAKRAVVVASHDERTLDRATRLVRLRDGRTVSENSDR